MFPRGEFDRLTETAAVLDRDERRTQKGKDRKEKHRHQSEDRHQPDTHLAKQHATHHHLGAAQPDRKDHAGRNQIIEPVNREVFVDLDQRSQGSITFVKPDTMNTTASTRRQTPVIRLRARCDSIGFIIFEQVIYDLFFIFSAGIPHSSGVVLIVKTQNFPPFGLRRASRKAVSDCRLFPDSLFAQRSASVGTRTKRLIRLSNIPNRPSGHFSGIIRKGAHLIH